jgi:hypothetical protein
LIAPTVTIFLIETTDRSGTDRLGNPISGSEETITEYRAELIDRKKPNQDIPESDIYRSFGILSTEAFNIDINKFRVKYNAELYVIYNIRRSTVIRPNFQILDCHRSAGK